MTLFKRAHGTWWGKAYVRGRLHQESLCTKVKKIAVQRHAVFMRRMEALRFGGDATREWAATPVERHLVDYEQHLLAKGDTLGHVKDVLKTLRRFREERRLVTLGEVTLDQGERWLAELAASHAQPTPGQKSPTKPLAPRSINRRRQHLRGWAAWLARAGRTRVDVLVALPRRREVRQSTPRRALTPAEIQRLLSDRPLLRRAIYLTALSTGLRRSELGQLLHEDFDPVSRTVRLRAPTAKDRGDAVIPLPVEVVDLLVELRRDPMAALVEARANRAHGPSRAARLFPAFSSLATFYSDLAASGIPQETPEGRIDFHALRVTFASLLEASGASLAMAQKLMRHSTPVLTANVYTHLQADARRAAVDALPLPAIIDGSPGEGGSP